MAYDGHGWVYWTPGEELHSTVTYHRAASGQAHRHLCPTQTRQAHYLQLIWFQTIIAKLLSGWNDNLTSVSLGITVSTNYHDYNNHVIRLFLMWQLISDWLCQDLGRAHEYLFRVTRPSLYHVLPRFLPHPFARPFNTVRWKVWPARLGYATVNP